ncbi:hypothetical protein ACT33J_002300 [Vibrio fluvialis]
MATKIHKFWFKIRRRFYNQPVAERLYYLGFTLLMITMLAMSSTQKMGLNIGVFKYILGVSIVCIIIGFLTDLYALGKTLYKYTIFKWLFALSFSALVVTANILAKKDIYAITGFNLIELTDAQLLISIVNIPLLIVTTLTFIAMVMSLISMAGQLLIGVLKRLNYYALSRILIGTAKLGFLLKFVKSLGFDSDSRPMAAGISMFVFVMFLVSPPSYNQITLQSVKAEIIVWSSFYNGKDCTNLQPWQGYLVHDDKTIVLTYLNQKPSFDLGICKKS